MRKIIIDTDTAGDDAVAIIMALKSDKIDVQAITTVCGNVPVEQATKNALMTIEIAGAQKPPVYKGAAEPLSRDLVTAKNIHGNDGMGDCSLIHPTLREESVGAVRAILDIVKKNPGEIEIVTIGPVTNIAQALAADSEVMKTVKRIYSMGTSGFGPGNITAVAEFNVFVDSEAYSLMLDSGIPITIIGFDVCLGEAVLNKRDMEQLIDSECPAAVFSVRCNRTLLRYNMEREGKEYVDLPDAVAMGVVMWKDILLEAEECRCEICLHDGKDYGQVIPHPVSHTEANALVCKTLDKGLFKQRLLQLLMT